MAMWKLILDYEGFDFLVGGDSEEAGTDRFPSSQD